MIDNEFNRSYSFADGRKGLYKVVRDSKGLESIVRLYDYTNIRLHKSTTTRQGSTTYDHAEGFYDLRPLGKVLPSDSVAARVVGEYRRSPATAPTARDGRKGSTTSEDGRRREEEAERLESKRCRGSGHTTTVKKKTRSTGHGGVGSVAHDHGEGGGATDQKGGRGTHDSREDGAGGKRRLRA